MQRAPQSSHTGCLCSACTGVSVGAGTAVFSPDRPLPLHTGTGGFRVRSPRIKQQGCPSQGL